MPVIEYKLHKIKEGNSTPPFVKNGGNWPSPVDFSMIGWLDPEPRKYWVPDTIVELTENEFMDRLYEIHQVNPFTNEPLEPDGSEGLELTDGEVKEMAREWYRQFVTNNS